MGSWELRCQAELVEVGFEVGSWKYEDGSLKCGAGSVKVESCVVRLSLSKSVLESGVWSVKREV